MDILAWNWLHECEEYSLCPSSKPISAAALCALIVASFSTHCANSAASTSADSNETPCSAFHESNAARSGSAGGGAGAGLGDGAGPRCLRPAAGASSAEAASSQTPRIRARRPDDILRPRSIPRSLGGATCRQAGF